MENSQTMSLAKIKVKPIVIFFRIDIHAVKMKTPGEPGSLKFYGLDIFKTKFPDFEEFGNKSKTKNCLSKPGFS